MLLADDEDDVLVEVEVDVPVVVPVVVPDAVLLALEFLVGLAVYSCQTCWDQAGRKKKRKTWKTLLTLDACDDAAAMASVANINSTTATTSSSLGGMRLRMVSQARECIAKPLQQRPFKQDDSAVLSRSMATAHYPATPAQRNVQLMSYVEAARPGRCGRTNTWPIQRASVYVRIKRAENERRRSERKAHRGGEGNIRRRGRRWTRSQSEEVGWWCFC